MNTPFTRAFGRPDRAAASPSDRKKRISPLQSPLAKAARAFLTLALATCALGAAASAQTISIAPPTNTPNTPEGTGGGTTPFTFTVSIDQAPAQDVTVNFAVNNGSATGSPTGASPADFANGVGNVQVDGALSTGNTITFAAGSVANHTITVPVTADSLFETDETFSVSLSQPLAPATLGNDTALATIVNDDNPPSLSIGDAAPVTEGNGPPDRIANFPVTLSSPSGQPVTFTYNTVVVDPINANDGSGGQGAKQDFIPATNQQITIPAGTTTVNIPIEIVGDTIDEANGQFLVQISNIVGADNGTQTQGTGTIIDDDGPTVSVSDATATEGDGQIVFRISLSAPSPQPITVRYQTGSNSAQVGLDYGTSGQTGPSNEVTGTVTFDAFNGDPSTGVAPFIDVPIPVIDDNISEPTEIFNFTLISADDGNMNGSVKLTGAGARRQAIGTILDNDGSPNLTVAARSDQINGIPEGNAGMTTNAVFRVQLSNPSSRAVSFRYQTIAGTATENVDYTGRSGTATIPANPTGASATPTFVDITVPVIGDNIDEANETFNLRIFGATPGDVTINNSTDQTITQTIIDDDGPTISVDANQPVPEGNNGTTTGAAFTIRLSQVSPQDVTVNYVLGDNTTPNQATFGTDYTATPQTGTLTIPAQQDNVTLPITIIGDDIKENDEVIPLTLTNANGGSFGGGASASGSIIIADDDAQPAVSITGPGSLREGSGGGTTIFRFTATLDRPSSQQITANFSVNDGTAQAGTPAQAGPPVVPATVGDFAIPRVGMGGNTLTFPAGSTAPQFIDVPVNADNLNEDDENFSVSLSAPVNARLDVASATATILNDDALPAVSVGDFQNVENGDAPAQGQQASPRVFQFPVTLNAASGKDVTINYQTIGAGQGNNLTATSGADFTAVTGSLMIPAGTTTGVIPVTIIDDTLNEADETFQVKLTNAANAGIARATGTGTIIDNDPQPTIKIGAPAATDVAIEPYSTAPNRTSVNPGHPAVFPVTLSAISGRPITVRYSIAGTSATGTTSNDFQASLTDTRPSSSGSIIIPAGQTTKNIVIYPRGDDGNEPLLENFTVTISADFAGFVPASAAADATAASTVEDRDPAIGGVSPLLGFESFPLLNGAVNPGTTVTLTGDQLQTDNVSRIASIRFSGPSVIDSQTHLPVVTSTNAGVAATPNAATFTVPANAYSSFISVVLTNGSIVDTKQLFIVQPIITGFSSDGTVPKSGVPGVTKVTIVGHHFTDPRNPVIGVLFGGIDANAANSGQGIKVVNDGTIIATVPRGAPSGTLQVVTRNGGIGPASADSFTVNGFTPGGINFTPGSGSNTGFVYENARAVNVNGQFRPVSTFYFQLNPALQNNGDQTPLAPRKSFRVTVTFATGNSGTTAPGIIQLGTPLPAGISRVTSSSGIVTFDVAAGFKPDTLIPINITYTGNDNLPPATAASVPLTLSVQIISSNDPELYPVTAGTIPQVTFDRVDIHGFNADSTTILRTNENQQAADNRAAFAINLANIDLANPFGGIGNPAVTDSINTDARPKFDVLVAFRSSNPAEGRLTYYVIQNGQKVYPIGAQPQNGDLQVIYAVDPKRPEYYRNPHFVQAIGQDDQVADGAQPYTVTALTSSSADPEYSFPLSIPFQFVNTDNEQGSGNNDPGYLFSKTALSTNENGSTDFFTTRLRTQPTGNVTINLQTDRPDEMLFVDPKNPNGAGLTSINVTYLASGNGDPNNFSTNWRIPLTVRVRGVDDNLRDGDQTVRIITSVATSADPSYGSIDPVDLSDVNADNESNGITVFPTTLNISENATGTFSVRLNAQPTSDVVVTFSTSDPTIATVIAGDTLTFTSANYNTPQTVTVAGVSDGKFTAQRTVNIISSAASSGDPNFNNLAVADVSVIVRNTESAFVVTTPTGGIKTAGNGTNTSFTVALGSQPTTNVTLTLTVSPSTEALIARTGTAGAPTATLTFTPSNFGNPQTVNVLGVTGATAGDHTFTITGRVGAASDPAYLSQVFPPISGVNTTAGTGTGGGTGGNTGTTSFAPNSTYTFSVPFGTSADASSTISVSSLFTPATAKDFTIYRFDVANQKNTRVIGQDFQPVTTSLQRGVGYLLKTGATALKLNTTAKAFAGTTFSFALTRNTNFVNQTGQSNSNNGYNFIGFPFDPSKYAGVSFASAQVTVGTNTYSSIREAAAAGVLSDRLYTVDAKGVLTQVAPSDQVIRPYRAYFVQVFRDNVTLTFNSPTS